MPRQKSKAQASRAIRITLRHLHALLHTVIENQESIMSTQSELAAQLRALKTQNEKARQEILAKVAALEGAIATAGSTTPEVDAALEDLRASIQADDDMNPDAPPV